MMSSVTRPERVTPYKLPDDGTFPNSSLPLLAYQSAVDDKADDLAITFEHVFQANGWGGSWRNGMYCFRHYHSNVHEVLGIARGQTHVEFGGPRGEALELTAGDAVVIPAGVSHFHLGSSADLLVIGAYELLEGSAPLKVVLAEAGILAERYGGEKSSSFVRGTLSRLADGLAG